MALELRQATVAIGKARLIQEVTLAVRPGALTVVLGANGAGKSTTLAVLAGDLRPTGGEVLLDGRPLAAFTPHALAMRRAVVLQHAPMNFALTVHEVVSLSRPPGAGASQAGDEIEARALDALQLLALAGRDYSTLSGGERQRVQIARALAQLWHHADARQPGYLLMDEPTAHLDLKHQIVALEVAQSFAEAGGGALCILHDVGLAREFASEVILMKDGRIAGRGRPEALLTAAAIADIYGIPDQRARRFAVA
jgi:iron complex transport system ATP-binding protein